MKAITEQHSNVNTKNKSQEHKSASNIGPKETQDQQNNQNKVQHNASRKAAHKISN